jgi:hypothetical protein
MGEGLRSGWAASIAMYGNLNFTEANNLACVIQEYEYRLLNSHVN